MNIQSAKYYTDIRTGENASITCVIDGKTMSVPIEPKNRHYAEILKQVEAGILTIEDAD